MVKMEIKAKDFQRTDGRSPFQLRQIDVEKSLLNQANGSARFSQGNTSVLVSVHGPMEVKPRKELIDRATVEFYYKPKDRLPGSTEREREHLLRSTLESVILSSLHPRTSIMIVIQELNDDGCLLSTAINGACLALIDAGIPMKALIASCTCAMNNERKLLLDPNALEEREASILFTFAFNSSFDGVVTSQVGLSNGGIISLFNENEYRLALNVSKKGCQHVLKFLNQIYWKK